MSVEYDLMSNTHTNSISCICVELRGMWSVLFYNFRNKSAAQSHDSYDIVRPCVALFKLYPVSFHNSIVF